MTTRILDRSEWPTKLVGTELEPVAFVLPSDTQIIVVEDGDQVVGCWAVIRYVHVEGIWIAPAYRRTGSVVRRLLRTMTRIARAWGASAVLTGANEGPDGDVVRNLLLNHLRATRLPGEHYVFPLPHVR